MGPPGAGKGTQAQRIASVVDVNKASSGDLFRENITAGSELGILAKSYMDQGVLVPDDVTIKLIMGWIQSPEQASGFVLDGFPRTLNQAESLDRELNRSGSLDRVLYINVNEEELVERLSGRFICANCQSPFHVKYSAPTRNGVCDFCGGSLYQRSDDKPEVVRTRLGVYFEETAPLVEYYRKSNILREINGEGDIEVIGESLLKALS